MHASKKFQCCTFYNYTENPYITRVLNSRSRCFVSNTKNIKSLMCVLIAVQRVLKRKGNSVQMEWPNLIQASGYTIYHTLRGTRAAIKIENNAIIYEGKNHSSKYTMINVPPHSTCISFEVMNITLEDAGFYSVGTTDDDFSLDRAIFLIVICNCLNVAIVMH